jgi:hypothetical protein
MGGTAALREMIGFDTADDRNVVAGRGLRLVSSGK